MTLAGQLLTLAAQTLGKTEGVMVGRWPRTAAVLGRQAIEASLADYWGVTEPSIAGVSNRAQFLSLPVYLGDDDLAGRVRQAWASLSRASHYRSYELAPTESELRVWLGTAKTFYNHIVSLHSTD